MTWPVPTGEEGKNVGLGPNGDDKTSMPGLCVTSDTRIRRTGLSDGEGRRSGWGQGCQGWVEKRRLLGDL